ncbi:hypothetical protein BKA69DRAFT_63337 [Paraphysoderma sedebokerense]|nr:hypothetical protein BKA69DRAFT_63337 [Paraphysoderma sedebokerense]
MDGKDVADIYLDFVFSSSNSSSLQTFSNEMIRNAIINFASQSQNQSSQSYNSQDVFSSDQNTVSYIPSTRSELKSYIMDCVSSCVKLEFVGNSDTLHYHKFQNDIRATWDRFVAYLLESYFELSKPLSIVINSNMDESIMIAQRGCLSFLKTMESVETLRLVENGVIGIGELESSLGNGTGNVMKNEAVKTDINSFVNFCAVLQQMGICMTNEELMTFLGSNRNDIVGTVEDEAEMLFTRFSFTSQDVFGWENLKLSAMQFDDIKGFVEQVVRLIIDTDLESSQTGDSEMMERSNQTTTVPTEITTTLLLSTLQSCIQNRLRVVNILMVLTYFVILIDRYELEIGFTNVKQTLDDLKELFRWYYFLGRVFKIQVCVESGNANVGVRKMGKDDTNLLLSNRMEGLSLTGGKPSNRYGGHEPNFGNEYTSVLWNTLFGPVSTGVKLIPLSPSNIAQTSCQLLSLLSSVSFHSSSQKAQLGILKKLVTYFDLAIVNENDVRDLLEMCESESWVWYLWGRYYLVLKEFEKAKDCFEMAATGISGPGIDTHLTDDVNLLQVLSISPTPSVNPSPLTSSFTTPLKPSSGFTSGSSFGINVKMNDFYSNVITLFEEKGYSEGVIAFAKYALESVDCENISSKREVMIDLYQLIFTHSLHIQDYDGAYTAMTMNPDPNSQERCLSSLVTTMCQRSASNKLVKFPFVGLQSTFSNELRFKARNMKSLELLDPEEPNYFDIGFNWFVGMGDFRSGMCDLFDLLSFVIVIALFNQPK